MERTKKTTLPKTGRMGARHPALFNDDINREDEEYKNYNQATERF